MWKFITVATSLWHTFAPIIEDVLTAIDKIKAAKLEDVVARDAVKQDITDLIQKHALKNTSDSKINACIEICYQLYLIRKG